MVMLGGGIGSSLLRLRGGGGTRAKRSGGQWTVSPPSHDGPANGKEMDNGRGPSKTRNKISRKYRYIAAFRWWTDEYRCAMLCLTGLAVLSVLLWHFDRKLAPDFGPGLELDMIVIAIMTLVRVALGSIVESCLCQGAWIWVSKAHQARTQNRARLEDFKLFDEASRGLLGSLGLIWRLKGLSVALPRPNPSNAFPFDLMIILCRHLSCVGALIIVITHGFETFSQQMFVYVQEPLLYTNETSQPAPAPFRSDY